MQHYNIRIVISNIHCVYLIIRFNINKVSNILLIINTQKVYQITKRNVELHI